MEERSNVFGSNVGAQLYIAANITPPSGLEDE